MALTFLDLTNDALKRLNEVPLKETNFTVSTGFAATMKDAVNAAIRDINQAEFEWPFNHQEGSQILSPGVGTYDLPADCKTVDWDSFMLERDDSIPVDARHLRYLDLDEYKRSYAARDKNDDLGAEPDAVYRTQNLKFGITPKPDEAYTVTFDYWGFSDALVNATDTTTIPDQFRHVIVEGAMYYGYLFRENQESAQLTLKKFQQGIKQMRSLLINRYAYIADTRIRY